VALVLDAGALVAIDRAEAAVVSYVVAANRNRVAVRTSSGVVAQVWRDGAKQARLARLLKGVDERALDKEASRRIGSLLGAAKLADVIDGSIVDIARHHDEILTSDPGDIAALAEAAGKELVITPLGG
jgi:hypothetical protein